MQSNFFLGFSTFFDILGSKTRFLGSGTIANASGSKFGAGSRSPYPKLNFLRPFQTKFNAFRPFLQGWFFRTIRVFGIHKFLQMWGLYGLPCTPTDAPWKVSMEEHSFSPRSWIWDQHHPKNNFQVGLKAIFELVRPKVVLVIFQSLSSSSCTTFWGLFGDSEALLGPSWAPI